MTKEQELKINMLTAQGYLWDRKQSISAAGVIVKKGNDVWFFGLNGEIMHNPQGIVINLTK